MTLMYAWKNFPCQGFDIHLFSKVLQKTQPSTKKLEIPSSINLNLTSNPRNFQNSCLIETGLSNLHRMIVTAMKASFENLNCRVTLQHHVRAKQKYARGNNLPSTNKSLNYI